MKLLGNLIGNSDGTSELRSISIEKIASAAESALAGSLGAGHTGRIIYNTDSGSYKYWDGSVFVAFATGGDATAVETKLNNLIAAGGFTDSNGDINVTVLNALDNITGLTAGSDLVDALTQLDAALTAAAGVDTIPEMTDVTITSAAAGDFIVADGTGDTYVNLNGVAAQQAMGVEVGVDVQAFDADLSAIAALTHADGDFIVSNGSAWVVESDAVARTSLDVYSKSEVDGLVGAVDLDSLTDVSITSVTSGDVLYYDGSEFVNGATGATSGVQAYDAALASIAGLTVAADEMIYATGVDTYATTSATAFGRSLLDDADEATARATLGLVAGGAGDIWVEKAGDTMTGVLNMGTNKIISLAEPSAASDAATKQYVDSVAAGMDPKESVRAATTADLGFTYLTGTLTAGSAGTTVIDGITLADGNRVLVKNQTDAKENGIYVASDTGAGSATVLTRSFDMDGTPAAEVSGGNFTFVEQGTASEGQGFIVIGDGILTLDTDDIVWTQVSGAGSLIAGVGLGQSGNEIFVNLGAGIFQLPLDEIGIELYNSATGAIILTEDGSTRSVGAAGMLHLLLNGSTLEQTVSGLNVAAGGITETEINASVAGDGLQGGAGTALSVDAVAAIFEFTTGELDLVDGGIQNAKLANTGIAIAGDTGSDTTALGETVTIAGGTGIDTAVTVDTVTVNLNATADILTDVPAPVADSVLVRNAGNTAYETQSVSSLLGAGGLSDLSDVDSTVATAGDGDIMIHDGTNFKPQQAYFLYTSGSASTSHTVTHSLGAQYCNVTVIDSTDEMVIPQSVTFDSANQLTVTFNTSIDCKVVVMGIA